MAGYQKPGIEVTELDTPSTTIVLDRPTVIGLVGQARGNEVRSDILHLVDNDPVVLKGVNIVTTPIDAFVVKDINLLNTTYSQVQNGEGDYVLTTVGGVTTIKRHLYTTMTSKESVVAVIKTGDGTESNPYTTVTRTTAFSYDSFTDWLEVFSETGNTITAPSPGDVPTADEISIQRAGRYTKNVDYDVDTTSRLRLHSATYNPTGCRIFSEQTVYVSYTTTDSETGEIRQYVDEPIELTHPSYRALAHVSDTESVNSDSIIVRNAENMGLSSVDDVVVFTAGVNGNAGVDFEITFDPSSATARQFKMKRNVAGTDMGLANNYADVRVDYKYIPADYYMPTLFSSYHEVEAKYGPAFNRNGTIANPLSAGAYFCFRSGSNEIITQALFTTTGDSLNGGIRIQGNEETIGHWATTLESLQGQTSINVLVPVVGQSDLSSPETADATMTAIQNEFVSHINTMGANGEYVIALFGEDSSANTTAAANALSQTLRDHANMLSAKQYPERTVLITPGSFKIANPVDGSVKVIGGQYVAAMLAGLLARDAVQSSLTRKQIPGVIDVGTFKNESEKDADAANGLLVIENKNGTVRVRHAVTTSIGDDRYRELNVVRSKFFMIESIRRTLDANVIGRIINNIQAPFIVSASVVSVLETMRASGAIASYGGVTAVPTPNNPTSMTVRFTYTLPYAINNIEVAIALDSSTGAVAAQ